MRTPSISSSKLESKSVCSVKKGDTLFLFNGLGVILF